LPARTEGSVRLGITRSMYAAREMAVLRIVVRAFHVFHLRRNGHRAAQVRAYAGERPEIRSRVERQIYLARSPVFVAPHALQEIRRQILWLQETSNVRCGSTLEETTLQPILRRIQHHAAGRAVLHQNLADRGLRADFCACFARRRRDRQRDAARTAAAESPNERNAPSISPM